jgi:hypothetical protein
MKKKAKSMELVTVLLTWCDSTRGEAVKRSEGGRGREEKDVGCQMPENSHLKPQT